jgi:hypothetical protein
MSAKRHKKAKNRKQTRPRTSAVRTAQPKKAQTLEEAIDRMHPIDRLVLGCHLELLLTDLREQIASLPVPTPERN